ncbi:MAG: effector binding domain-containing protein [Flavobacteriales bacterium]|nr:effector binding domain-containing protein [Flavobacteriales bacterium]
MEKPRITRLTAILTVLQSKSLVTAAELAERYQVSVRTIYRDIRTLEESGIPIYTEEGKGYRIQEGYRMPPVMFTEHEAQAMITALTVVRSNSDQSLISELESAVEKIKSVMRSSQKDGAEELDKRMYVKPQVYRPKSDHLLSIQSAILNSRVIQLEYQAGDKKKSSRRIEPLAVYSTQGNWIVIAYCQLRKARRSFRLDGILSLDITPETFESGDFNLRDYFQSYRFPYTPDKPLTQPNSTFVSNKQNMKETEVQKAVVAGLGIRTQNGERAMKDIPKLWEDFMKTNVADQLPNRKDNRIWSVYTEYEGGVQDEYQVMVGYEIPSNEPIPEGMVKVEVEPGKYAQFTNKGALSQGIVQKAWGDIWNTPLDRTFKSDFEIYGDKAMNPEDMEFDIFVGIRD